MPKRPVRDRLRNLPDSQPKRNRRKKRQLLK
jgi:hypothetical protein